MTTLDLRNNDVLLYRLGKAGESSVAWGDWKTGKIHLTRKRNGEIATITPQNDFTAEFSQSSYCGDGIFNSEEFYFQIAYLRN
jgi:hypothetical protein